MIGVVKSIINILLQKFKKTKYLNSKQAVVAGHDDIAKVCNVLFDPRQVGRVIVQTIAIFRQRVALKSCGFEDFRTSNALLSRHYEVACLCVAVYGFAGSFPARRTIAGVRACKMYSSNAI